MCLLINAELECMRVVAGRCVHVLGLVDVPPPKKERYSVFSNKGVAVRQQYSAHQDLSGSSWPLIEAVERFGVMKCRSSGQSLIHGDEQESKSSVTFPLTLNTPFQFTQ